MKTFYFFQIDFDPNKTPHPVTYAVSFHNSGGMLHNDSRNVPFGRYFSMKPLNVILNERSEEVPVIIHSDDPRLRTYTYGDAFCIASPDQSLIELVYLFFCHGFNSGCKASLKSMQDYYDKHPISKERT